LYERSFYEKGILGTVVFLIIFIGWMLPKTISSSKNPMTRVYERNQYPGFDSNLKIIVEGETNPLLGDETFIREQMRRSAQKLLERRGYTNFSNENSDYTIKITYRTNRFFVSETSSLDKMSTYNQGYYSTGSSYGVNLANMMSTLRFNTTTQSSKIMTLKTITTFEHIISMEIITTEKLIWKGDVYFNSRNIDLMNEIIPVFQKLLSGFPKKEDIYPLVQVVKKDKLDNYYKTKCKGYYFMSPALPYKIEFKETSASSKSIGHVTGIENPEGFEAFVDLLQTAEIMLPTGVSKYKDPFKANIWSKVRLGGTYYLGSKSNKVHILIDLVGKPSGYLISKARIVSQEEYQEFKTKLKEWNTFLENYFDFYE